MYTELETEGYFDESFGFDCVDQGHVPGKLGPDIESKIFEATLTENLWPITKSHVGAFYDEDDLFDVIEFLFDAVSRPLKEGGRFHDWNNCGWHYLKFNRREGREHFRTKTNDLLLNYKDGFQLSEMGQIFVMEEKDLEDIFKAKVPSDNILVQERISLAISKYRESRSNLDERGIAVKELVDVLEGLRPAAKKYLYHKDEGDLFNLANNFGIRHNKGGQKTNYDKNIWYSWMFYYYLSTIHALLRMIKRSGDKKSI